MCVSAQGLAPARIKIDPSTYNYTREDTMADPSSIRPLFFTLYHRIVRLIATGLSIRSFF